MMDHLQDILFEIAETTGPSQSAATLVIGDRPVSEVLATLVNLSEPAHGARPFQYMVPFLAERRPFPLSWRDGLQPLHIVDVGSEELATEGDMHAPLRAIAPATITGFDPFAPGATGEGRDPVTITRSDGTLIHTYPLLVADGRPVTFHVNRYGPTSSLLDSNYELAGQFGLLKAALETVETRSLPSSRLDDVLCADGEVPRVDLLKIDVQGSAHTVLANAPRVLANTLICHVEAEFSPVYRDEKLFGEIDGILRAAGFCFVDFFSLGRQRYAQFESSVERAFHRGRTLWADCIYIRNLDQEHGLSADDLFRAALIVHACYNKQDLAAELLARLDRIEGTRLLQAYLAPAPEGTQ